VGRYFIDISYNGANYGGWQSQNNAPSIQETMQRIGRLVLKQDIVIVGSSRTDAGVHAIHQIAQLDFEPFDSLEQHVFKWNMALPNDISIAKLIQVNSDSRCRFDAVSRSYEYIISKKKDPFWHNRSLYWYGNLDISKLNECCSLLMKYVEYEAFSKVQTQVNHFECQILEATWKSENDLVLFEIRANRFLRGMVRALVGTMMEVGKGKKSVHDFERIILSKDRKKAGENVPAYGLYLVSVNYPDGLFS